MTIREAVDAIERDRKEREQGLLLYLLALANRARANVNRAIRVGVAWTGILRGVLLGDERIDQPGGVSTLSRGMADGYLAGHRRAGLLVGQRVEPPARLADLAPQFTPTARGMLDRMGSTLQGEIERALRDAAPADAIATDVRSVGEAFARAGYTPARPSGAATGATTAVTQAYAGGMSDGLKVPTVRAVLTGLRFVNPNDAVTTDICRARAGIILPTDSPWLFTNWPPLHFGCRSVVLPTTGPVKFTENPAMYPPPMPGWGRWGGLLASAQYA